MTQRQFNESLRKGEICNHYVLLGYEPILIDRAVNMIKETVKVEESFDFDRFSLPDATLEDIAARLYLMPINSKQRLVVVKNLEEVPAGEMADFADFTQRNNGVAPSL